MVLDRRVGCLGVVEDDWLIASAMPTAKKQEIYIKLAAALGLGQGRSGSST